MPHPPASPCPRPANDHIADVSTMVAALPLAGVLHAPSGAVALTAEAAAWPGVPLAEVARRLPRPS